MVMGFGFRGFGRFVVLEVRVCEVRGFEVRVFGYVVSRFGVFQVRGFGYVVSGKGCRGSAFRYGGLRSSGLRVESFEVRGF